ncbi:MAG: polyprenyl synthetase family protein [Candidatus Aminicenantes bacterium]|nr:polyprenyl synthetase family protein [Candidatus Aminicenantes bacterium]
MIKLKTAATIGVENESPHRESLVEWWFIQGTWRRLHYGRNADKDKKPQGDHSFMISFFRLLLKSKTATVPEGSWLIASILSPDGQQANFTSMVDHPSLDWFIQATQGLQRTNADSRLIQAYLQEVADYGPPAPIRLAKRSSRITDTPLFIRWNSFSLAQRDDHFALAFAAPKTGNSCRFCLHPTAPRLQLADEPTVNGQPGKACNTYPSLTLSGTVGGKPVQGHAWLDHQWGDLDWFRSSGEKKRLLGWSWLGISFDDGKRLLVTLHHDAQRRRTLSQHLVLLQPGQPPRLMQHFTATPTRRWKSERSGITYPLAWRLEIPGLKAALDFRPLADDQEIPILGIPRAVWEGAGTIKGTIGRRPVQGIGRLELWGYGYIFDLERNLKKMSARVATNIASYFPKTLKGAHLRNYTSERRIMNKPGAYSDMLSRPLWDLIDRSGKRWRPIIGLLLLEALGIAPRPYEQMISVVGELPHTGSLIVDDIEDSSQQRRGQPSIHLRYGTDVAINAANTAYFLPFLILRRHPLLSSAQRLELYRILSEQYVRSHLGQAMDIYWSRRLTRKRLAEWIADTHGPRILEAYAHKTGSIVEGTAAAACVIAGSNEATTRACMNFARQFSIAFQILDDISGFETPRRLRKHRGEDLSEGKLTYVMLQALKALPRTRRDRLGAIFCSQLLRRTAAGQREAMALFRKSGALQSCRNEAHGLFMKAWGELALHVPPSEARIKLRALCEALLDAGVSLSAQNIGAAPAKLS